MTYLQKKQLWENFSNLDPILKKELNEMSDDQAKEAFTNDLAFGTGGLRGLLGVGTNRMNYYVVRKATKGFGEYLSKFDNAFNKGVVIAHDNRNYSKEFALDSARVLTKMGYKVYLFNELRPTPELSFAVRELGCIGGIMITASHNPKEYNGYKIYDESGCQLVPYLADQVIDKINAIEDYFAIEVSNNNDNITYLDEKFDKIYTDLVGQVILNKDVKKDFKIVFTPLHGTAQVFGCEVLKEHGFDAYAYEPQMINDPNFSNVQSSNPEDAKAYTEAIAYAKEIGAKIVLATDPDADRLGIAVENNGEFVLLNGNQTATLMVDYILSTLKKQNKLPKDGYVFSTNVSSALPLKIAEAYGMKTYVSLTGFKFIGEQAKKIEGNGTYVFGYEESYGSLIKDFVRDKDAIQAILMACEVAAFHYENNLNLLQALDNINKEYGYTVEGITNIALAGLEGAAKIERIINHFRTNELDSNVGVVVTKEDNLLCVKTTYGENNKEEKIDLPKSNVIKYTFDDGSNFILRPSGTEPKLKVYYNVYGNDANDANNKMQSIKDKVLKIVDSIK